MCRLCAVQGIQYAPPLQVITRPLSRVPVYPQHRLLALSRSCSVIIHIRFFENGFLSINFPISKQIVGARAPGQLIHWFWSISASSLAAAVENPIEVDNPFVWKTRSDVVQSI